MVVDVDSDSGERPPSPAAAPTATEAGFLCGSSARLSPPGGFWQDNAGDPVFWVTYRRRHYEVFFYRSSARASARRPAIGASRDEAELVILSSVDDLFARSSVKPAEIDALLVNCSISTPTPVFVDMVSSHMNLRKLGMSSVYTDVAGKRRSLSEEAPNATSLHRNVQAGSSEALRSKKGFENLWKHTKIWALNKEDEELEDEPSPREQDDHQECEPQTEKKKKKQKLECEEP
ncbi:hypothetical protein EJB05_02217, partial [Eragrostis curvula]